MDLLAEILLRGCIYKKLAIALFYAEWALLFRREMDEIKGIKGTILDKRPTQI
jgi:hypothetical protein